MKYKQLGNTGLLVSQLALGTMTFNKGQGLRHFVGSVGQEEADQMVKKSVDIGINLFDTANVYGDGDSEITLGQSFRNLGIARQDVVVSTKVAMRVGQGRIESLQAYYSLAGRDLERELAPLLEAKKLGLLVWSPLAGGLLSGRYDRHNQKAEDSRRSAFDFPIVDKERAWNIIDTIKPIAEAHGTHPASIALAWLLNRPFCHFRSSRSEAYGSA